jgi:hypothetical protein
LRIERGSLSDHAQIARHALVAQRLAAQLQAQSFVLVQHERGVGRAQEALAGCEKRRPEVHRRLDLDAREYHLGVGDQVLAVQLVVGEGAAARIAELDPRPIEDGDGATEATDG